MAVIETDDLIVPSVSDLMNAFGEAMFNGCDVPFETEIQIRTRE